MKKFHARIVASARLPKASSTLPSVMRQIAAMAAAPRNRSALKPALGGSVGAGPPFCQDNQFFLRLATEASAFFTSSGPICFDHLSYTGRVTLTKAARSCGVSLTTFTPKPAMVL